MTTPYTLQRKRADLLTRMRADTLGRTPFSETMAAMLANAPVDLNSMDSTILFLVQHFRAGEINVTIDAAVSRAFGMRRDRASHSEIGARPRSDERLSVDADSSGLNDRQAFPILKGAAA